MFITLTPCFRRGRFNPLPSRERKLSLLPLPLGEGWGEGERHVPDSEQGPSSTFLIGEWCRYICGETGRSSMGALPGRMMRPPVVPSLVSFSATSG